MRRSVPRDLEVFPQVGKSGVESRESLADEDGLGSDEEFGPDPDRVSMIVLLSERVPRRL